VTQFSFSFRNFLDFLDFYSEVPGVSRTFSVEGKFEKVATNSEIIWKIWNV
jgi:hypothetical protein